jgi:hypothetical protein
VQNAISLYTARLLVTIFVVVVAQFLYLGITTTPESINESDSLTYHIPIARSISRGDFYPPELLGGLGFYPAASEVLLSGLMVLGISLNVYGTIGLLCLFLIGRKVAKSFGLHNAMAIIYGVSIAMMQSVLRLPLAQTIDIWLAVFFLASLDLLKNPQRNNLYFLKLGICGALVIGSKYSGIPYYLALLMLFGQEAFKKIRFSQLFVYLVPVLVLGLSWYIRNYLLTNNPLYPANFLFLKGYPNSSEADSAQWSVIGNILTNPRFMWSFAEALISEYLLWIGVFLLPIYIWWKKIDSLLVTRLSRLGMIIFCVFLLFLPALPIVSNLRYLFPAVFVLTLAFFLLLKGKENLTCAMATVSTIFAVMNLPYQPKILMLAFVPAFYFIFIRNSGYVLFFKE